MKRLYCSPERIFEFRSAEGICENAFEALKKINFFQNKKNFISYNMSDENPNLDLRKVKEFKELHEWFLECVKEAAKDLKINKTFKIIHSWANKSEKGQSHHPHAHPYSIISGTYYLTTNKEGGETWFQYPATKWSQLFLFYDQHLFKTIKPEAGKLILFPSNIYHGVEPNKDDSPRYTISFDTFIEGKVASHKRQNESLDLELKIIDE